MSLNLININSLDESKFAGVMQEITQCNTKLVDEMMPVFIAGKRVLAISKALFHYYRVNKHNQIPCIKLADEYSEELDLQYLNFARGITVRYFTIRDHYDDPSKIEGIGFDNSELDFMYKVNLDNERYDIKVLESDAVVLKKDQFFTIKCKTREESILVRQYFQTTEHEISFDKFEKVIKGQMNSLAAMFGEKEELIPLEKLEQKCDTNFRIKYDSDEQLKEIFTIFKLSAKKKTVRVSYKLIKDILV